MDGDLEESWQDFGVIKRALSGFCSDGTCVKSTRETIWCDVPNRLARFRRTIYIRDRYGHTITHELEQQKHPVSAQEVQERLKSHGFSIEQIAGDRNGRLFTPTSNRAIFWARKLSQDYT